MPIAASNAIPLQPSRTALRHHLRLTGLTDGAARTFDGGLVIQALVEKP